MARPPIAVELLAAKAADDPVLTLALCDRINRVYAVAENGLWRDGTARTDVGEVAEAVGRGEIAVARLGGRVVGSVRIVQIDAETGEFGLLVADPEHRGVGIGRELVGFAERFIRSTGRSTMQLELLVPRGWTHPVKTFLHDWYSRLGYRMVRTVDFAEARPERAPFLATDCDLLTYQKALST